ncbi:hypothetical protein BC830DRAFT_86802 [Chytriomyces sp. MP71]|nr:hypothetical protein BC830DRAFT_86802 [Chytriomyces sp. MP71]
MFVQIVVSAAALLANSAQAFDGTAPFLLSQSTRGSSRGSEAAATFADAVSSVPCVEATLVFAQNKAHASDLARFADSYKSLQHLGQGLIHRPAICKGREPGRCPVNHHLRKVWCRLNDSRLQR